MTRRRIQTSTERDLESRANPVAGLKADDPRVADGIPAEVVDELSGAQSPEEFEARVKAQVRKVLDAQKAQANTVLAIDAKQKQIDPDALSERMDALSKLWLPAGLTKWVLAAVLGTCGVSGKTAYETEQHADSVESRLDQLEATTSYMLHRDRCKPDVPEDCVKHVKALVDHLTGKPSKESK